MPAIAASRGFSVLRRAALAGGLLLLGALVLAGGIYGYWVLEDHRLTVISPGRVYQSAAMPPETMIRTAHRLGVQTVFDFRGDDGDEGRLSAAEQQALTQAGIRYIHIPSSIRPAPETVTAFLQAVRPEVAAHRPVLLHCKDGQGRSVFFSAVYRMEFEGWSNQHAYLATTRLPPSLMFLGTVVPSLARLSPHNAKTPLILHYQREQPATQPAPAPVL